MPREFKVMKAKVKTTLYDAVMQMADYKQEQFDVMISKALTNLIVSYDIASKTMKAPIAPDTEGLPSCPQCQTPVTIEDSEALPAGFCIVCMQTTVEVQVA